MFMSNIRYFGVLQRTSNLTSFTNLAATLRHADSYYYHLAGWTDLRGFRLGYNKFNPIMARCCENELVGQKSLTKTSISSSAEKRPL